MLIPTTDVYGQLSLVSASTFTDILPYLILIIGIILAFYIVEMLIDIMSHTKKDNIIRDKEGKQIGIDVSNDGYHRIFGKSGQEIGWEKD